MSRINRRILVVAAILISALVCNAKVAIESGDLSYLLFAKQIPVTLTYSNAVFAGVGDFDDFMLMAKRDADWYSNNIDEFTEHANKEFGTKGYGFRFVAQEEAYKPKCSLNIDIRKIERNGHISGKIYVIDSNTHKPVVTFNYKSDDAEPDDDDVFEDQLESIGESLGKLLSRELNKELKKLSK